MPCSSQPLNDVAVIQWRETDAQLPTLGKRVLVSGPPNGDIFIAKIVQYEGEQVWDDGDATRIFRLGLYPYWAELPKPPSHKHGNCGDG